MIDETLARIWDQLSSRTSGPLAFRFILQPIVSTALAIRAGVRDAHGHRPAFLWSLFRDPRRRRQQCLDAARDVSVLFGVAMALDIAYQVGVLRLFYPVQALVVAGALALGPYLVFRGLVTRVAVWMQRRTASESQGG
jgi:hypothetical protein